MTLIRKLLARSTCQQSTSRGDAGAAMITTILVSAVLAGLGIAIVDISLSNIQNAGRDRLGGRALATSESGVAQAIEYIKTEGVGGLYCSPNCPSNPWGNETNPQTVTLTNGRQYKVWIKVVQNFAPPVYKTGTYRIYSQGTAGQGPGLRNVEMTISATPFTFPIGLYADTYDDAGAGSVHTEHMFSRGCIINRNAISFGPSTDPQTGVTSSVDPYYGYPPAAHSANYIVTANQPSACNQGKSIHAGAGPANDCHASYKSDQDAAGGSISGTACADVTMGNTSSFFDVAALDASYGYTARGLTQAQYAALRAKAESQGNYWTNATLGSYVAPCVDSCPPGKAPTPNGVLYFRVSAGTVIQNELDAIKEFTRSQCGTRSLVIVVEGGDVHVNKGVDITTALFVPDGNLQFNGQGTIEGTVFAKTVQKFNGTADFYLDQCFINNFPGGLFDVTPVRFHEVDR